MSNEAQGQEKVAGTNLTAVPEYAQTALVLNDLKQRFAGRVFESLETDAQRKAARKDIAEVRDYRTALEAERKRIKAPALERCRLIDAEAARLTTELRALEDPMKAQLDAKEAEIEAEKIRKANAEAERVKGHMDAIQRMRDFPLSLQGKPSSVMQARLDEFEKLGVMIDQMEEFRDQGCDAFNAAAASSRDLITRQLAHEAEQEQIKRDREELAKQRAENERLQREAEERREADARREREAQEERDRAEREAREQVEAEERAKQKVIRDAEEAAQREAAVARQRELDEAAEHQRQEQARLDRERAEHAAQVERDRIVKLGLMEAVKAIVDFYENGNGSPVPKCISDLVAVYNALPHEKREAAKPVRKPRAQA